MYLGTTACSHLSIPYIHKSDESAVESRSFPGRLVLPKYPDIEIYHLPFINGYKKPLANPKECGEVLSERIGIPS